MDNINKTFISERGYGLLKEEFDYKLLSDIRDELTVSPKTMNSFGTANITKYKIYTESSKKLYLPKYYGLKKFGKPDVYKLNDGKDINIKFNGELRENQLKPVEKFLESARDPNKMGGLINLACASGKTVISLNIIAQSITKLVLLDPCGTIVWTVRLCLDFIHTDI